MTPWRLISAMTSRSCSTIRGARPSDGSSSSSTRGIGHQRAADREHLLLAAGEQAGALGVGARAGSGTARRRAPGRAPAPPCRAPPARRRAGSPRRSGGRRCAAPRGPAPARRARCRRARAPTRLRPANVDRAPVIARRAPASPRSRAAACSCPRRCCRARRSPRLRARQRHAAQRLDGARVADVQVADVEQELVRRSTSSSADINPPLCLDSHHTSLLGWPVVAGLYQVSLMLSSDRERRPRTVALRCSATCPNGRAEGRSRRAPRGVARARLVEVRQHRVLHVRDRAVAGREHRVPASGQRDSTTRPWLAAGERTIKPSASSATSTSFIDCGVT